jgi:hypothetical protein
VPHAWHAWRLNITAHPLQHRDTVALRPQPLLRRRVRAVAAGSLSTPRRPRRQSLLVGGRRAREEGEGAGVVGEVGEVGEAAG